jgi:TetR/AcrR family transcriptional regulator, repressor of fatR-cypB operon
MGSQDLHGTIDTVPKPDARKLTKRDAILNAMLDVVVERGFHEAPMSLISERSGASAGVIYHYFRSKEEIIQALHARVLAVKHTSLLEGYLPQMDDKAAFLHLFVNAYNFYHRHQREMRFLEQYAISGFICTPDESPLDEDTKAFQRRFSGRKKGGVLNDWPLEVLQEMTLGLVERLARQPRKLSPALLHEIAEKTWRAVKASN